MESLGLCVGCIQDSPERGELVFLSLPCCSSQLAGCHPFLLVFKRRHPAGQKSCQEFCRSTCSNGSWQTCCGKMLLSPGWWEVEGFIQDFYSTCTAFVSRSFLVSLSVEQPFLRHYWHGLRRKAWKIACCFNLVGFRFSERSSLGTDPSRD